VLHRPRQVAEPDIDELHLVIADEPEYLVGVREHLPSLEAAAVFWLRGLRLSQGRDHDARHLPFPSGVPGVSRVLRLGLGQLTDGDRTRGRRGTAARYRGWRVSFTGARRSGPREQVNLSRREVRAAGERVAVGREHGTPPGGPGDRLVRVHADRV